MKKLNYKKQQGFSILAVILVIVAVIVAIGVWALSGQTNTSNSGNSTSDIQASSIVNDASSIKLAFDTLIVNGSDATKVVFVPNTASTAGAPNMLDPTNGIQAPKANTNAIRSGATAAEGVWVYNGTAFKGHTVGTTAADQAILLAGIKDTICQRINNTLYGKTEVPAITVTTPTASATSLVPTTAAAVDLLTATPAGVPTGWTSGCIGTGTADSNFYFRILRAN